MDTSISTGVRIGMGVTVLALAGIVYAQLHLDDVVAFVQWVTEAVVEDKLGITKEMLEGQPGE